MNWIVNDHNILEILLVTFIVSVILVPIAAIISVNLLKNILS